MSNLIKSKRLESLDILRGFDLFMLVFFQPVFVQLASVLNPDGAMAYISDHVFSHIQWEGFAAWDLVMPLFLFMTGASIPFAFSRFKKGQDSSRSMFRRIAKRVFLLWLFGTIIQGNILDLDIETLRLYSNTLQSIAIGYLFASLIYMYLPLKGVIAATMALPVIYTAGIYIFGGGVYLPAENLAEIIDRSILGHFVDGAIIGENGVTEFSKWYNYAWIYPSINFTTTVLAGVLTTCVLRSEKYTEKKKVLFLLAGGVACIIAAYALSPIEPIVKKIWTSTMTLLSSGYSIILMALFYYFIDVLQKGQWVQWLKFYGMNSILAYMLYNTLRISSLLEFWLHGLEQFLGDFYPPFIELAYVTVILLILRYCYKKSIFLKV